ncbi:hypothetical protein Xkoz_01952 [Xenorhabdus kozodoii]|uniref:Uncharacterized protein n=1 Tax=Xenorhabdus kozodoii TaxID=351676 RepID=A0A2D0LC84_9GAMM|nr:hypothetical protein Xkoz_01952 [Xenorhabdus kozodoii]
MNGFFGGVVYPEIIDDFTGFVDKLIEKWAIYVLGL